MRRSLFLLATILAACAGPVDSGQVAWQATLNGGPGGISGSVAALSASGRTRASIAIQRAVAGQSYGWRIQQGDCQAEGALVGGAAVYPTLLAGDDGTAGADIVLSRTLTSGHYAARVVKLQAGGETLAACAALQQVP